VGVLHVIGRLLVALLLACPVVVVSQATAHAACSCTPRGVEQSADRADAVFRGTLVDQSTGSGAGGRKQTTYDVAADHLYKGDISAASVEVVSPGGDCGLGELTPDKRYMFFVEDNGSTLTTDRCNGTARADATMTRKVEKVLGEGTTVGGQSQAPAEQAEFTKVADAEPDELSRVAAPGAALVIVGLLGLLLVGRLSRRRD
jgi:hypothetical protein